MSTDFNAYRDLAQEISGGLIITDINEMVQFVADKSSLRMLQLLGGTIPSGVPGVGFKTRQPLIAKKAIANYEHKWIKQAVQEEDLTINGALTVETTFALTAGTYTRAVENGVYQIEHPTTGEFLEVVLVHTLSGTPNVAVRRNIGGTTNAVIPTGSILRRRGLSVSDRSSQTGILDTAPTTSSNLSETIRVDWEITWKGQAQKEYGNLNDPEVMKRRKLYQFAKDMNWKMLYGKGGTSTDKNGKRVQFMTGLTNLLTSNLYGKSSVTGYSQAHGGELTLEKYRNVFLRRIARLTPDDVNDIIVLHGDLIDRAMDFWYGEKVGHLGQEGTYLGWDCKTINVGGKRFIHMYDAMVDENDTGSAIVFPASSLKYCYTASNTINLDAKHYEIDFQQQGITSKGGFYLADITLEIGWEQGMGYMTGMEQYS